MVSRIAIIPARGGSKRLPRKNILPLAGKPLLVWSIEAALHSSLFDRVCVSTEDLEIACIAKHAGADVLDRPIDLASDQASVSETCLHHLQELYLQGYQYDFLYCLYPTAPLRNSSDLQEIARIFKIREDAESVIAACEYLHYPFQALALQQHSKVKPFWPHFARKSSSDFPELVAGNGSTYAISVKSFLKYRDFYTPDGMYVHLMEKIRSIDVDTSEDFALLEACIQLVHSSG